MTQPETKNFTASAKTKKCRGQKLSRVGWAQLQSRYCTSQVFNIDPFLADYDRVDQLVNDKPHTINKIMINIRKHSPSDAKTMHTPSKQTSKLNTKRRQHSSTDFKQHRIKQHRSSLNNINLPSPTVSSKRIIKQKININCSDDEIIRLKNANDLLIREVQSLISTSTQSIEKSNHNDISHLQNEYERLNTQMINLRNESIEKSFDTNPNDRLNRLHNDVENLLKQIKNLQPIKTFADELFEKYTIEYILSLNEHDIQQRLEQLEKENQLLLLIKQVR